VELAAPAFAPLRERDFRLLFAGSLARESIGPLQFLTLIFFLQEHAPEPLRILLVGLVATTRGVAMLGFGPFGGALADRFDRRRLLLACEGAIAVLGLAVGGLLALESTTPASLVALFAGVFALAAILSVDIPARLALIPDLVGPAATASAVSLHTASFQVAAPVMIFASGFVIDTLGFGATFALAALGPLLDCAALSRIRHRSDRTPDHAPDRHGAARALRDVRDGIAYARRERVVLGVIAIVLATFTLGMPAVASLGPTWVTTVVGVPYRLFGLVAMTWGIGGLATSIALTRFAGHERKGTLLVAAALGFGVSFAIFASGRSAPAAALGNLGLGAAVAALQITSTSLLQSLVPDAVRGRVMSLLQLGMGMSQLVALPVAALGQAVSLEVLFPCLAFLLLGSVASLVFAWPEIRGARVSGV
jgi:MFS family permease